MPDTHPAGVLGTHTVVTVPCVQMVTASGCNITLRGDIVRRSIICRLDAQTERPELRDIDQDLSPRCVRDGGTLSLT
jgi:putative DNA primase/helicase